MEKVSIQYSGPGFSQQTYSSQDNRLVSSNFVTSDFGDTSDYIEFFIYDANGNLVDYDYNVKDYYPDANSIAGSNRFSALTLDPEKDLKLKGYSRGLLNIQYNFFRKLFNSSNGTLYWIKEISSSRTEIKISSQVLSDILIRNSFSQYQSYAVSKNYFPDFYLNFGNNELVIANNVAYVDDADGGNLLIKLYEPLPAAYDMKSQLWIVDKVAESVSFNVDIQTSVETSSTANSLRGPNFKIAVNEKTTQTTPYYNYTSLLTSPVSSSYQKLMSYYQDKSVAINVDYSDFGNFIHFSSATERLNNFVYKLELIEGYNDQIAQQSQLSGGVTVASTVSSSIGFIENSINNIIQKFDVYEYYLYFNSGSWSWPKMNTTQPYQLYSVTSSAALNWLGSEDMVTTPSIPSLLYSASFYDATNKDLLKNTIPQYLLDDPINAPYATFMDMMGQHFDNIWLYYKDVTNRYDASNNPNTGISLDVVSDALRSLGFELYTNTNVSDNLFYTLFGINQDGSLLPPTGSEHITSYVTSSLTTEGPEILQGEIYKRLYHNLPYLLKTKGTQRSIKALISTFGIPDDILTINEFGGEDRYTSIGISEINNDKVYIGTGSMQGSIYINGHMDDSGTPMALSASVLSPFATLQYYNTDRRLNSTNLEVGFSTAYTINTNISSSLPNLNMDQLIGNPEYMYSGSYPALETQKQSYFSTYTKPHSVWEFIRLIKYYNNSLFKTIKDFVPARANLSTGIIVKSHILERNKYARHEPSMSVSNNFSQSIDMVNISASAANSFSGSTANSGFYTSSIGIIPYTTSDGREKFTGAFKGTQITATTMTSVSSQNEISKIQFPGTASFYTTYSLSPLYQNVSASVRSKRFFDLDYTSNQLKPINYGLITQSISRSQFDNYNTYTNPNNPYAELQDYNYSLNSFTVPRYYGSKTISATYNDYTSGDQSYGNTAAIDKLKFQYAYLVDMYSSSLQLPGRVNAQIKYIFSNDQNVLNLTKGNENLFTVQNVYKSGESVDVSLFDYDPTDPNVQYFTNNQNVTLFEGGFRYSPILYNLNGSNNPAMNYIFKNPFPGQVSLQVTGSNTYTAPNSTNNISNFSSVFTLIAPGIQYTYNALISYNAGSTISQNLRLGLKRTTTSLGASLGYNDQIYYVEYPVNTPFPQLLNGILPGDPSLFNAPTLFDVSVYTAGGIVTTTQTIFYNSVQETDHRWYAVDNKTVRLTATQSLYYGAFTYGPTGSSAGIDTPVFPLSLEYGDMIRFYNSSSQAFGRSDEFRVVSTYQALSGSTSYYYVTLDRGMSTNNVDSGSFPGFISRYVALKHVPDETNLILNYSSSANITQDGLIFPQYLNPLVRKNSGNLVKALKQQNLI